MVFVIYDVCGISIHANIWAIDIHASLSIYKLWPTRNLLLTGSVKNASRCSLQKSVLGNLLALHGEKSAQKRIEFQTGRAIERFSVSKSDPVDFYSLKKGVEKFFKIFSFCTVIPHVLDLKNILVIL